MFTYLGRGSSTVLQYSSIGYSTIGTVGNVYNATQNIQNKFITKLRFDGYNKAKENEETDDSQTQQKMPKTKKSIKAVPFQFLPLI